MFMHMWFIAWAELLRGLGSCSLPKIFAIFIRSLPKILKSYINSLSAALYSVMCLDSCFQSDYCTYSGNQLHPWAKLLKGLGPKILAISIRSRGVPWVRWFGRAPAKAAIDLTKLKKAWLFLILEIY